MTIIMNHTADSLLDMCLKSIKRAYRVVEILNHLASQSQTDLKSYHIALGLVKVYDFRLIICWAIDLMQISSRIDFPCCASIKALHFKWRNIMFLFFGCLKDFRSIRFRQFNDFWKIIATSLLSSLRQYEYFSLKYLGKLFVKLIWKNSFQWPCNLYDVSTGLMALNADDAWRLKK